MARRSSHDPALRFEGRAVSDREATPCTKNLSRGQKERKAVHGQTLTALGSYWKGRKPLILVKACVLGALLPATGDSERDLDVFEKLMAIDDRAFLRREPSLSPDEIARRCLGCGALTISKMDLCFTVRGFAKAEWEALALNEHEKEFEKALESGGLRWSPTCPGSERNRLTLAALSTLAYLEKLNRTKRPEELADKVLYGPNWDMVNAHLGTEAHSFPELIEQLGTLRFGHRPRVGDTFCGGGSIPFEAARLGCDVYASDLNPIACLLTWGALHLVGGNTETREQIARAQAAIADAVDREITTLGIEHDDQGNRAKAYLWCLETRCPQTGWMVPMATTWIISKNYRTYARLVPDRERKRFEIEIVTGASSAQLEAAAVGTVVDNELVYELDGETYRTRIETLRGDYRLPDSTTGNRLRHREKSDIVPHPDDVFQERLYCIQWITRETLGSHRPKFFFAAPTEADLAQERTIEKMVRQNLARWQDGGVVPDMAIESGDKTDELIRTRGWTYWHHLFSPRHLLTGSLVAKRFREIVGARTRQRVRRFGLCRTLTWMSKLTRWNVGFPGRPGVAPSADTVKDVFYNQAFNTFYNYGSRSFYGLKEATGLDIAQDRIAGRSSLECRPANKVNQHCDLFVTDPPYADAINYHEITEYFIAWLTKTPTEARMDLGQSPALAIKAATKPSVATWSRPTGPWQTDMPDNGLQIVMFTHQDASVWADMASIVWGAGLRVTAAWYIATETSST